MAAGFIQEEEEERREGVRKEGRKGWMEDAIEEGRNDMNVGVIMLRKIGRLAGKGFGKKEEFLHEHPPCS